MTKLVHPDWEHRIVLDDGSATIVVIENRDTFRTYISQLIKSMDKEGPFILSEDLKEKAMKDYVDIILSPFCLSFSDKRLTSNLQSILKSFMVSEDNYEKTMSLITSLEAYADSISEAFPSSIEASPIDVPGLLKLLGFSIKTEYETDQERILEYMNVMHDICGIEDFFFVSAYNYFTPECISSLVYDCQGNKHNTVFIETINPPQIPDGVKLIVIDSDNCEIF